MSHRRRRAPSLIVIDLRSYPRHRGRLLIGDRLYLRGLWTPLVRVRARVLRAAEGGGEW